MSLPDERPSSESAAVTSLSLQSILNRVWSWSEKQSARKHSGLKDDGNPGMVRTGLTELPAAALSLLLQQNYEDVAPHSRRYLHPAMRKTGARGDPRRVYYYEPNLLCFAKIFEGMQQQAVS